MPTTSAFSTALHTGSIRAARVAQSYEPSLLALSMWMRAFFVGASLAIAGLVSLLGSDASTGTMVWMTLAGVVLAAVSLGRTQRALRATTSS